MSHVKQARITHVKATITHFFDNAGVIADEILLAVRLDVVLEEDDQDPVGGTVDHARHSFAKSSIEKWLGALGSIVYILG